MMVDDMLISRLLLWASIFNILKGRLGLCSVKAGRIMARS
jgi:hypothetical protein